MKIVAKIKVAVVFEAGQAFPRWFVWEGRKYDVRDISYVWKDTKGLEQLHYFSVTDGANCYELVFNASRVTWRLGAVS